MKKTIDISTINWDSIIMQENSKYKIIKKPEELSKLKNLIEYTLDRYRKFYEGIHLDKYIAEHSVRVMFLSLCLSYYTGYDEEMLEYIILGSFIHDIGKSQISRKILNKKEKITKEEEIILESHVVKGYDIVKEWEISEVSKEIVHLHHERKDGTGYPLNLKGDKIPHYVFISSLSDVFDALTSDRPYRLGVSPKNALGIIRKESKVKFDYSLFKDFERMIQL